MPVAPAGVGRAHPGLPLHRLPDRRTPTCCAEVIEHVADDFAREGSNAWFTRPLERAAAPRHRCPDCGGSALEKTSDIVDVWFESGVSWAAVADGKLVPPGEKVDLYLEGADQHRGWFHSSLLTAVGHARARRPTRRCSPTAGCWTSAARSTRSRRSPPPAPRAPRSTTSTRPCGWRRTAPSCCACGPRRPTTSRDIVFSARPSSISWASRTGRSATPAATCCRTCTTSSRRATRCEDDQLRELDLLALGVLRERDHQVFEAYRRYSFHEVVRLMVDYVITVSAEYLDPVKDALYCEAPGSPRPAQRADRPARDDAHPGHLDGAGAAASPPRTWPTSWRASPASRSTCTADPWRAGRPRARSSRAPNKRWTDEIRPRREAILRPLEAFRAGGHKSLEARVEVTPAAAERPHWQWNLSHLAELCVVSQIELDRPTTPAGETEITVDEAPGPECPRCWRRTGEAYADGGRSLPCRGAPAWQVSAGLPGPRRWPPSQPTLKEPSPHDARAPQIRPVRGVGRAGHRCSTSGPRCWPASSLKPLGYAVAR